MVSKQFKPWPSKLNPCTIEEHHTAALYDVNGIVTKVCVACIMEKAKEIAGRNGESEDKRHAYVLDAICELGFKSDPNGNPVKYS